MKAVKYVLTILVVLITSCTSKLSPEAFTIRQSEEKNGFIFKEDVLKKNDQTIFRNLNSDKEIIISPSPDGNYYILIKWDTDYGGEELIVIDASTNIEVTKIPQSRNGRVGKNVFWSSDDRFAVITSVGEIQNSIYLVDIDRKKSGAIKIKNLERNRCELQSIIEDFSFEEKGKLKFHIDLGINPWWDSPGENLNCTEGKFYPTYLATLDLKSLRIEYVED